MIAQLSTCKTYKKNYSEKDLDEALRGLNEAAEKLEAINSKLKGEKQ
jgi:hypothetical protein